MKKVAQIISGISNPLVIAIPFTYALVFRNRGDAAFGAAWTIISMAFAALVALYVFYGVRLGIFSDYDVSRRAQRPRLFIFTAIVSVMYFAVVYILNGPRVLLLGLAALIMGDIIAEVVNTKIKASMHMAVFSAFAVALGLLYSGTFWIVCLFAPVVAWSRIVLKRHTLPEAAVGTMLGVSIVFVLYLVVQYLIIK